MRNIFRKFLRWLRVLDKSCGALQLDGRDLTIVNVKDDSFVVQDVFGRERPFTVNRNDPKVTNLELQPVFL